MSDEAVSTTGSPPASRREQDFGKIWLTASVVGIVAGGALWIGGATTGAKIAWAATTAIAILPSAREVIDGLLHRRPGVETSGPGGPDFEGTA